MSLGGAFFGESMFARVSNASKVAFFSLAQQLGKWGFSLLDCQISNPHLHSLGAYEISRAEFLARLSQALNLPTRRGRWG
jgi:leucyl/phenylalanyl-tRNA--protein transferase